MKTDFKARTTEVCPTKDKELGTFCDGTLGFTILEMMIAVAMFAIIMAGVIGVYVMCQKLWHATSLGMMTSRDGSIALSRMVYGIGTNSGLRTASSLSIENNMKGMWTGTNYVYPPAAGDSAHFLNPGLGDGSWRITCSNAFDGIRWIDFNKVASNIVLWVESPSDTNRATRQLVGNYVSAAVVSSNGAGVSIQLTIIRQDGRYTSTNRIGTFVMMRNI
jgi:prepilin-type N-terminal cleavage/methylation domain-containing protein